MITLSSLSWRASFYAKVVYKEPKLWYLKLRGFKHWWETVGFIHQSVMYYCPSWCFDNIIIRMKAYM